MADSCEPNAKPNANGTAPNAPSNPIIISDPPKVVPAYCDLTRDGTPQVERRDRDEENGQGQEVSAIRQETQPADLAPSDPRLRARNTPNTDAVFDRHVVDLTESPQKATHDERRGTFEAGLRSPPPQYCPRYYAGTIDPTAGMRLDRRPDVSLDELLAGIDGRGTQPSETSVVWESATSPITSSAPEVISNPATVTAVFCDLTQGATGDQDAAKEAQSAGAVPASSNPNLHNVSIAPLLDVDSPVVVSAVCELTQNENGVQPSAKDKEQEASLAEQEVQPAMGYSKEREAKDRMNIHSVPAEISGEGKSAVQGEIRPTIDISEPLPDAPDLQPAVKPEPQTENLPGTQTGLSETERRADEFLKWLQHDLAQSKVQSESQKEALPQTCSKALQDAPGVVTEDHPSTQPSQNVEICKAASSLNWLQQEMAQPQVEHTVHEGVHPRTASETLRDAPDFKIEIEPHAEKFGAEATQAEEQPESQQPALKRALPDNEQGTTKEYPASPRTPKKQRIHEHDSYASTKDHFLKCLGEVVRKVKQTSWAIKNATNSMENEFMNGVETDFSLVVENIRRNVEIMHEAIRDLEGYMAKHLDAVAEIRPGANVENIREQARAIVKGAQIIQDAWVQFVKIWEEETASDAQAMEGQGL
ncbi:uncharacterized protein DSM5745_00458 [Aspergillus mulundensis]|uniref:Uncharacterized protein n=1 Tax=Aspergillus mulundensis TaxID=1810919 RepID=A0A3D8T3K2_9EURO|nr:hypothetical protein DSM5745_00458 [Aspergillus mulundensis]RDW93136.1 hypothetical protein DSM5745_00458 [Aspergillus mulundensis]